MLPPELPTQLTILFLDVYYPAWVGSPHGIAARKPLGPMTFSLPSARMMRSILYLRVRKVGMSFSSYLAF